MTLYSTEEIKKGFDILGLSIDKLNITESANEIINQNLTQADLQEIAKAPNSTPIMGSIGYGKLERPSR